MNEEKVYFEDEAYLITSKRLVHRKLGKTIPMSACAEARPEQTPVRYEAEEDPLFNGISWLVGLVRGHRSNSFRGALAVVVKVNGKQVIAGEFYYPAGADCGLVVGTPQFEERVSYYRELAIAIGAAITGA